MTKKMISWLSFMAVFCLIIYSCRTDESIYEKHDRSETDKIEAFSKFESHLPSVNTTGKSSSEYVSYHEPFKEIIQNFMNNNPEYAERFQREAGDIYFDLRSFTYGETTKGLAYPIMKDGIVNAVLIAMVNEKRDWVTFIVLKNSSSEVTSMIAKFQKFYDALGKAKGREQMQEEQIEEVVIVIYQSIPGPSYIYYQPYTDYGSSIGLGSGMSGGPTIHQGGGFYNPPQTPPNPCEKTKNMLNKPQVQQIINDVKTQALKTLSNINEGELGFKEKKDGTIAPADVNASHKVIYNNVTDGYGGYHNHTALGTHMFSPPDIADTLLGFAAAQDNVSDAYFGMIAAEWCNCPPSNKQYIHYVMQYTGSAADIGNGGSYNFTQAQITQFENDYRKTVRNLKNTYINGNNYIQTSGELNKKGLEKLFFEMLNTMGLTGKVILQKVEANGTINNITLDNNNMPTGTPCP